MIKWNMIVHHASIKVFLTNHAGLQRVHKVDTQCCLSTTHGMLVDQRAQSNLPDKPQMTNR